MDRQRANSAADPELTATSRAAPRTSGTVTGVPRRWHRLEAAVLLGGSLIAYSATGQPWWLVPATILVPDLLAVGYLGDTRLGARLYNVAHSTVLPAAAVGFGWWQGRPLALALGLVWLAHIGADRLLGYGLKYDDNFQHPTSASSADRRQTMTNPDGIPEAHWALLSRDLPHLHEERQATPVLAIRRVEFVASADGVDEVSRRLGLHAIAGHASSSYWTPGEVNRCPGEVVRALELERSGAVPPAR